MATRDEHPILPIAIFDWLLTNRGLEEADRVLDAVQVGEMTVEDAEQIMANDPTCGNCGSSIYGAQITDAWEDGDNSEAYVICPSCRCPNSVPGWGG